MKATTKDTKARKKSYNQKYFSKEKDILNNISFKRAQGLDLTEEEAKKETQVKARRARNKERMAKRRRELKGKAGKGDKAAIAKIALTKEKAKESMRALRASNRAGAVAPTASLPPAKKIPQRKKQPAKANAGRVLKPAGRCPTSKPREVVMEIGSAILHHKAALAAREGGRLHLRQLASESLEEVAPIAARHNSCLPFFLRVAFFTGIHSSAFLVLCLARAPLPSFCLLRRMISEASLVPVVLLSSH